MFWKRFFIVVGILIILAFVAQLFVAPYVKRLITQKSRDLLGLEVSVGNCAVSILGRKIILEDISIPNPDHKDDYLLKAKEVSADFYLIPLLFNRQILRTLAITKPEIILYRDESGALQLPKLKESKQPAPKKKSQSRILLGRIIINDGSIKFIDQQVSKPATITALSGINCQIVNSVSIASRSVVTNIDAKGNIEERGRFSINGQGDFLSKPESFEAELKVEDLPLVEFTPYYGNNLSILVKNGNLNLYSKAACNKGDLDLKSNVKIDNIDVQPIGDPSQTILFELKTSDVLDFLKDEKGTVNFSFQISGPLYNPDFKWGPEIQKALRKAMLRSFTEGVGRLLLKSPEKLGEKVGKVLGEEAGAKVGEAAKKIGEEIQKIIGK